MYRYVDAVMLRAPVAAAPPAAGWPAFTDDDIGRQVEGWLAWLRLVYADEDLANAIAHASPTLAVRLAQLQDGHEPTPRQARRLVTSTLQYLLRGIGRATPFGLFAGIATVHIGKHTSVDWRRRHRPVAAVDAEWLDGVVTNLERQRGLQPPLTVVANSTCHVRGDRLIVPYTRQPTGGGEGVGELSIRHSEPVARTLQIARTPIRVENLLARLSHGLDQQHANKLAELVDELIARQVLHTDLRPPTTGADPLDHLLGKPDAADTIEEVAPTVHLLRHIRDDLTRHNTGIDSANSHHLRATVTERMEHLHPTNGHGLAVDLALDCDLTIPEQVVREAESAATTLTRLTPHPTGFPNWRRYHALFLDRYGPNAVVPLLDLINPDVGLGYPAGYRDSPHPTEPPLLTGRDELLLAYAQHAALDGATEITLDQQAITDLGDQPPSAVAASTELAVRVHAHTRDRLDRGDFHLAVTGISRAAGTLTGRFWPLLHPAERQRTITAHTAVPTSHTGALAVQVAVPPLDARLQNVTRIPAVLPLVTLDEHHLPPGSHRLPLAGLAVTGDTDGLRLVNLDDGRTVEPVMFHALELTNHTHPLARFLSEITSSRAATCVPFSWGAAARLPYLPRIRHGRTILAPARWRLTTTDLPNPQSAWPNWVDRFERWQHRTRVPRMVFLGDDDQRLRLDLTEPAHLHLLRTHLDRTSVAVLREAPTDAQLGWFDGRIHELVIPLAATTPRSTRPAATAQTTTRDQSHLPGASVWLYVRLYAHPDRHTTILTRHLPQLLAGWETPPPWWFIRYPDPRPHLRLRFRLHTPTDFGDAAHRVGAWAAGLHRAGLAGDLEFATHQPETGRYGTGTTMNAAEHLFAADSAAAITQLHTRLHRQAVTAASMIDLVCAFTGGHDTGMAWLIEHAPRTGTTPVDRTLLAQTLACLAPHGQAEQLAAAWHHRRQAATQYRQHLDAAGWLDPDQVLASLLHLHHARTTGVNPASEHICLRLARAAALTRRHTLAGSR